MSLPYSRPTLVQTMRAIRADVKRNQANPKSQLIVVSFRVAHYARGNRYKAVSPLAIIPGILYRIGIDWILGAEIPWRTQVGPGLALMHARGIVVHDDAVLGPNVTLRQGVTIGKATDDGLPPILLAGVNVGAGAIIIGELIVGTGAVVGAGAVVVKSVPAHSTVVGNPARIISKSRGT